MARLQQSWRNFSQRLGIVGTTGGGDALRDIAEFIQPVVIASTDGYNDAEVSLYWAGGDTAAVVGRLSAVVLECVVDTLFVAAQQTSPVLFRAFTSPVGGPSFTQDGETLFEAAVRPYGRRERNILRSGASVNSTSIPRGGLIQQGGVTSTPIFLGAPMVIQAGTLIVFQVTANNVAGHVNYQWRELTL